MKGTIQNSCAFGRTLYGRSPAHFLYKERISTMKKMTAGITAVLCAVMMIAGAGCSNNEKKSGESTEKETTAATTTTTTAKEEVTTAESAKDTEPSSASETESAVPTVSGKVKVEALKGPTAMGMIKLLDDSKNDESTIYDVEVVAAPDEVKNHLIQGSVDIACIPANLAATLYNKTEGGIEVLAVNTLGVIYIVENGTEQIKSVADLKGKTVYASGQGSTPEYALNYLLAENGVSDDVNIEWKAEHAECLTAITAEEGGIAMLPQPFVTTAQIKNGNIKVSLDLTAEWDKLNNGSTLITGVVVARKEFAENNGAALADFLAKYESSVKFVQSDNDGAAALIGKYDIVPEAVAKKALPACNIVFISGNDMKNKLSGYLQVLFDSDPKSVGGKLPADDFYYIAQ